MKTTPSFLLPALPTLLLGACATTPDAFDEVRDFDATVPHFDAPADGSATFVPQCPGVPIEIPVPFLGFTSLAGATFTRFDPAGPNAPINMQLSVEQTDQGAVLGTATGLFSDAAGLPSFHSIKYVAGESLIVGPVIAFDLDGDVDTNGFESFNIVIGMRTTFGRITKLCMMSAAEGSTPFLMTRIGL